jgi:hypothetical protein
MESALHPDLQKLFDFYAEQRTKSPDAFVHGPGVVPSPTFFSAGRFQEHLNNPLLTPNWIALVARGQMVPLEPAFLWKTVQNKELLFMDKELINEHLSRGAAVLLEGLDILEPSINALAARLDASLPCALTNCVAFLSQRANEAYEGHCDVDDVLVIHLEGEKRWRIFERQQRRFVDNGSLSKEQMGRQLSEVVMRRGDALYLRAGVPHVCQTTADYSLHVSFDLGDKTPAPKLITQEANTRYDKACAEQYAPASKVIDTYIALLKSDKFQSDLGLATNRVRNEAIAFRRRIGKASVIRALDKFAQKKH